IPLEDEEPTDTATTSASLPTTFTAVRVDQPTRDYFTHIMTILDKEEEENVNLLLENVFQREIKGKEAALVQDKECSYYLESILEVCEAHHLEQFYEGVSQDFDVLMTHWNGCRVIEKLVK